MSDTETSSLESWEVIRSCDQIERSDDESIEILDDRDDKSSISTDDQCTTSLCVECVEVTKENETCGREVLLLDVRKQPVWEIWLFAAQNIFESLTILIAVFSVGLAIRASFLTAEDLAHQYESHKIEHELSALRAELKYQHERVALSNQIHQLQAIISDLKKLYMHKIISSPYRRSSHLGKSEPWYGPKYTSLGKRKRSKTKNHDKNHASDNSHLMDVVKLITEEHWNFAEQMEMAVKDFYSTIESRFIEYVQSVRREFLYKICEFEPFMPKLQECRDKSYSFFGRFDPVPDGTKAKFGFDHRLHSDGLITIINDVINSDLAQTQLYNVDFEFSTLQMTASLELYKIALMKIVEDHITESDSKEKLNKKELKNLCKNQCNKMNSGKYLNKKGNRNEKLNKSNDKVVNNENVKKNKFLKKQNNKMYRSPSPEKRPVVHQEKDKIKNETCTCSYKDHNCHCPVKPVSSLNEFPKKDDIGNYYFDKNQWKYIKRNRTDYPSHGNSSLGCAREGDKNARNHFDKYNRRDSLWFFNMAKQRSGIRWEQSRGDWQFARAKGRRGKVLIR